MEEKVPKDGEPKTKKHNKHTIGTFITWLGWSTLLRNVVRIHRIPTTNLLGPTLFKLILLKLKFLQLLLHTPPKPMIFVTIVFAQ